MIAATAPLDITIRPVRLDGDREQLRTLDASFVTNHIYRVIRTALAFALEAVPVDSPVYKDFPIDDELDEAHSWTHGFVAERGNVIIGFVAFTHQHWNRRTEITYIAVAPSSRGNRVGHALIAAVVIAGREAGMNRVWLETDDRAYPAIQFYRSVGFELCGLDVALYDPESAVGGEAALFFSRNIEPIVDESNRK